MIKIIESPQRSDSKISYILKDEILTVTIDNATEDFDFIGMPEGKAEAITPEILTTNPIISAEKIGEELTITLLRFYSFEEKGRFENV